VKITESDKNKIALLSLAMDLQRVAVGYHRGSDRMAGRFLEEALKRKREIDVATIKPYLREILRKLEAIGTHQSSRYAEEFLTYSILLRNAAVHG
jgi:hypothetical protein